MKTKNAVRIEVAGAIAQDESGKLVFGICNRLPFSIVWSNLTIPQVTMVWLAMRELTGDDQAGHALDALMEVSV